MYNQVLGKIGSADVRGIIHANVLPIIKDAEVLDNLPTLLRKAYEFPYDDYPVVITLSPDSRQEFKNSFGPMFRMFRNFPGKIQLGKPVIAGSAALYFLCKILYQKISSLHPEFPAFLKAKSVGDEPPGFTYFQNLRAKYLNSENNDRPRTGDDIDIWDMGSERKAITSVKQAGKTYDIIPIKELSILKLILDFDLPQCRACIPLSTDGTKILTTYQCLRAIFTNASVIPAFIQQTTFGPTLNPRLSLTPFEPIDKYLDDELVRILAFQRIYGKDYLYILERFLPFIKRSSIRNHKYFTRSFNPCFYLDPNFSSLNENSIFFTRRGHTILTGYQGDEYFLQYISQMAAQMIEAGRMYVKYCTSEKDPEEYKTKIDTSNLIKILTRLTRISSPDHGTPVSRRSREEKQKLLADAADRIFAVSGGVEPPPSEEEQEEGYGDDVYDDEEVENQFFLKNRHIVDSMCGKVEAFIHSKVEKYESGPKTQTPPLVDRDMYLLPKPDEPFVRRMFPYENASEMIKMAKFCSKAQIYWFFQRCITQSSYYQHKEELRKYHSEVEDKRYEFWREVVRRDADEALERYKNDPDVLDHFQMLASEGFHVNKEILQIVEEIFLYA